MQSRGKEKHNEQSGGTLFRTGAFTLAHLRFDCAVADGLRRHDVVQHGCGGPYVLAAGLAVLFYMLVGWFGTVIRRAKAAATTAGRRLVPLGE
jgi:hypothetical protein